ncbi:cyclically-permuted mutarotase family protein [Clostridium tarantellae]|uniref:Cyclically-permuted mutarotase family protein n=1 Tax=Clostridium tarantellae TaxID=39493 RepID=A0A6I1MVE1_9CLOT|nr:cyclically-permuted mutarotase family protein [Clostridium tarantellae]MPQ44801.1 cyclically-permuted mutarotase family protein [Clostridium tarantellae]
MKKGLTCLVALAVVSSLFIGCNTANTTEKATDKTETTKEVTKVLWEHGGDLEAQKGQDKNIGTAGLLAGKSGDYIIVGGGANFPEEPVAKGGPKKHYPDVYVLKEENGELKQVDHTTLDYEIGYGSSITTDEGVYYIGGSPDKNEGDNVTLFTTDEKGKITSKHVGDLPFTISDGVAAKKGNKIYFGLGKQDGKASNKFYSFDVETGKTEELASIPGESTRNQAVAQLLGDNIYIFSGGDKIAYTDGYKYDIKNNTWEKASDVKIGDEAISLLGASSVKLNDEEMMVIGGFNKYIYDNAVKQLNTLKDQELADFKAGYFGADPSEFNWNKDILIYNSAKDSWRTIGEVPFDAPCGEGLIIDDNKIYSINGEIKPGTRTNRMYSGTLFNE